MAGRHRSLLLRVEVREARKLCYCKHSRKHTIRKGEPRLIVREPGPAAGEKGYCADCGARMLDQPETQVAKLRAALKA